MYAETKYIRAASGGTGEAKAAGNYGAQFYPTSLAHAKGYQQIIWTDANTHEYLEEAGTMNIFFRVGDTLLTAPNRPRINTNASYRHGHTHPHEKNHCV